MRLCREGRPGGEQEARESRRFALHVARCPEFCGDGVSFWVVSGQSSYLAHSWSGFQREGLWEVGRRCLLPSWPLPNSPSCWWQHRVPYLDLLSCDSLASGHRWAWPGQGVPVSSSLTESGKIPVITTVLRPLFIFTSSHENSNKNKTFCYY